MSKPPPLTQKQKSILSLLEPQLKLCVVTANFPSAKAIAAEIQELLRPTGHETRLLQAKNWLYETAMESNNIGFAKRGFKGTIEKSSPRTRLHLEALSLISICYLREKNLNKAKTYITRTVGCINNIKSTERRRQFHNRLITRLEEESILIGLKGNVDNLLDVSQVDSETIKLIKTKSEEEILMDMGRSIPEKSVDLLNQVRNAYQLALPAPDRHRLPPPIDTDDPKELGIRTNSAIKRVAWRAICNPESELYQAWSQGLSIVYDKKYISGAIVAAFNSWSITIVMLAASVAALAIKFGAEVFCEKFYPEAMMIDRTDKR